MTPFLECFHNFNLHHPQVFTLAAVNLVIQASRSTIIATQLVINSFHLVAYYNNSRWEAFD
jgi:hypothetical protein